MGPKRARARKDDGLTPAERVCAAEASRLRQLGTGVLISSEAPVSPQARRLPRTLQRADGLDIIKRNARPKKKYLFIFPGTFSVTPGAKIGQLTGLDSRNPSLYIDYPGHGRLKLSGTLVFPKNALLTVKAGSTKAGRAVHVVDIFETLVVFSEWRWVGMAEKNPGDVPRPMPHALRKIVEKDALFAAAGMRQGAMRRTPGSVEKRERRRAVHGLERGDDGKVGTPDVSFSDSEDDVLCIDDNGDVAPVNRTQAGAKPTPTRALPVRGKSRILDYSKMFEEGEEEEEEVEEDDESVNEGRAVSQENEVIDEENCEPNDAQAVSQTARTAVRGRKRNRLSKLVDVVKDDTGGDAHAIALTANTRPVRRKSARKTLGTIFETAEEDSESDNVVKGRKRKRESKVVDRVDNKATTSTTKSRTLGKTYASIIDDEEEEDESDDDGNGHVVAMSPIKSLSARARSRTKKYSLFSNVVEKAEDEEEADSDCIF